MSKLGVALCVLIIGASLVGCSSHHANAAQRRCRNAGATDRSPVIRVALPLLSMGQSSAPSTNSPVVKTVRVGSIVVVDSSHTFGSEDHVGIEAPTVAGALEHCSAFTFWTARPGEAEIHSMLRQSGYGLSMLGLTIRVVR